MEFHNDQNLIDVDEKRVAAALAVAADEENPAISVSIVDDKTIHELNKRHLGHDCPTDVISFDYGDSENVAGDSEIGTLFDPPARWPEGVGDDVEGELIISAETARRVAALLGRDPMDELLLYAVHGVLHLKGFDDRTEEDASRMRVREKEVCAALGLADPWASEAGAGRRSGSEEAVCVYTDGACRGNPGPGGGGTRVLYSDGRVLEKGGGAAGTTNNRMELAAAIAALELTLDEPAVEVVTDSEYVRLGITRWVRGWKARGWQTVKGEPVKNRDLWERLAGLLSPRVKWHYVAGHSGDPDNERCDRIAVAFAEGKTPSLADGSRWDDDGGLDVGVTPYAAAFERRKRSAGAPRKKSRGKKKSKGGAGKFYLSLVNGVVCRHNTWPECEGRVKGVSGARFKKCSDSAEEESILAGWGVGPGNIA